jgi:hypothetical protein
MFFLFIGLDVEFLDRGGFLECNNGAETARDRIALGPFGFLFDKNFFMMNQNSFTYSLNNIVIKKSDVPVSSVTPRL